MNFFITILLFSINPFSRTYNNLSIITINAEITVNNNNNNDLQYIITNNNQYFLMKTWKNNTFYGYRGIQYAEAPINDLRFKPPKPIVMPTAPGNHNNNNNNIEWLHRWINSEQFPKNLNGNPCPSEYTKILTENCLYLNVYTKKMLNLSSTPAITTTSTNDNNPAKHSVIIYIHPGGFYLGSGDSNEFGPEYLLEKNLLLVTFNYRLATLGFASSSSPDNDVNNKTNNNYRGVHTAADGNFGLKDQLLVLQWVQKNIHYFGGNANAVTLMGTSAGAMSTALHLISPVSSKLFHRVILMSGSILPQLKLPHNQMDLLEKLANYILPNDKCNNLKNNPFECIRYENTSFFAKNIYSMFEYGRDNPIFLWLPVIEKKQTSNNNINNFEPFLIDQPLKLLQENILLNPQTNNNNIPILMGNTKNEFATSAYDIIRNETLITDWIEQFNRIAPICLHYERNTEHSKWISTKIWEKYFGYGNNNRHRASAVTFENINNLFADALIYFPMHRLAKILQSHTNIYYYKFTYRGRFTNFPIINQSSPLLSSSSMNPPVIVNGHKNDSSRTYQERSHQQIPSNYNEIVEHCDDLQYIFTSIKNRPMFLPTDPESTIIEYFTELIENFANNGHPNKMANGDFNNANNNNINNENEWLKYNDQNNEYYMDIGNNNIIRKSKPFKEYEFWNDLFPNNFD